MPQGHLLQLPCGIIGRRSGGGHALYIALWVLGTNGAKLAPQCVEFVDLHTGSVYQIARRKPRTMQLVRKNIKIIEALWPTI